MKKTALLLLSLTTTIAFGQQKWFSTYQDSIALVKDAETITKKFTKDLKKLDANFKFDIKTVLNTTPYLIFFYKDAANIPLWEQVIPEQKQFFYTIAGNETNGKEVFGLFFNGFYLPHELGHAFDFVLHGQTMGSYKGEYFANTVALLWWKKQHREKELKRCYEYARKMWGQLPNPVPQGMTIEDYFSQNYEKASQDPLIYGYMQFKQFIEIYEDKTLPDFDTFIKREMLKKS